MYGDDRDTVYKTDYRDNEGTGALTNYLQHDGHAVRDRAGREMTDEELDRFNDRSAGQRNRQLIISPANGNDLSQREFDRATREYMSEMIKDRPTADYVYSIHEDTENRHAQIAMTASDKSDLEMYPEDIREERERAHSRYQERQKEQEKEQEQQQEQQLPHWKRREENEQEAERGIHR